MNVYTFEWCWCCCCWCCGGCDEFLHTTIQKWETPCTSTPTSQSFKSKNAAWKPSIPSCKIIQKRNSNMQLLFPASLALFSFRRIFELVFQFYKTFCRPFPSCSSKNREINRRKKKLIEKILLGRECVATRLPNALLVHAKKLGIFR